MGILDDVGVHRNELKTDSFTTTISDLLGMYLRGDLQINPEYQRLFRWDLQRQSEYIESLLLNIPTPPLFFATNPDGKSEVIDGLQRLSTLIKFFSNEVIEGSSFATEENNEDEQNNLQFGTLLYGAPLISSLEGYNLKSLPETLVRSLRYTRIPIIVLEKESSRRARFHVFKRLNRSGSVLSDQEIRNCSARLFGNDFPEAIRKLAGEDVIKIALGLPDEQERKMGVEECILRLVANVYSPAPLTHSVIEFLDNFMEYASEGKFVLDEEKCAKIKKCFSYLSGIFPNGEAFKFWRNGAAKGQFSANLYDIISYGVYKNIDSIEADPDSTKAKIIALHDDSRLKDVTGGGSNTRKKHKSRLELGDNIFRSSAELA